MRQYNHKYHFQVKRAEIDFPCTIFIQSLQQTLSHNNFSVQLEPEAKCSVKTQITEMGSEKLNNFAFLRILKQIQKKSFQTVLTSKTCFVYFRNNRLIIPVENWWSAPLRTQISDLITKKKTKKKHTVCNIGNAKTKLNKVFGESGWSLL